MDSVLFVGGGSMGSALIKAIRQSHPATLVYLEEKDVAKRDSIVSEFGVKPADADTATKVDLIVLAVKPQDLVNVMENLNPKITSNQTVMSIAAGIKLEKLKNGLGNAGAVIRCMPNTPALIGRGYSTISVLPDTDEIHLERAKYLLQCAGNYQLIDESLQDSFTAVHGSGPAYVFLLAEHLIAAAINLGVEPDLAKEAVFETISGAAELMRSSNQDPFKLREMVTSPGGTTAAALAVFAEGDFAALVDRALAAAKARALELG
ncbi:MAG: hypothetical protein RL587_925 [Actinomycetota bacterium]|jgi:pyrroline-5-carboxylate reductase